MYRKKISIKVGKLNFKEVMRKIFLLIIISLSIWLFCCPKFASAQVEQINIVVNEIYSEPATGEVEWIELYNKGTEEIELKDFTIVDGTANKALLDSYSIGANSYLLLENGKHFSFFLNNSGDTVILKKTNTLIDRVSYGNWDDGDKTDNAPCPTTGKSIARTPNGVDSNIDLEDFIVQSNITPGAANPLPPSNQPPSAPILTAPANNLDVVKGKEIDFKWELSIDPDGDELSYDFYFGCSETLTNENLVEQAILENSYTLIPNKICDMYYWRVDAFDGNLVSQSETFSFNLVVPTYSKKIIVNEIMFDPPEEDTKNEWIELYNASSEQVDLTGWVIQDLKGSVKKYVINNLIIAAKGYAVLYRKQTGIVLNNDEDGVRLIQPDGNILYESNLYQNGDEGWAWARTSTGKWAWTTKITPKKANLIVAPIPDEVGGDDELILTNTVPFEIATGEILQYENKLVRLKGEIVSTSGNTFYLDDGSGSAKIYLQEKRGIEKPEMHKGDTFEILGIVNLYRNVWRVLPQTQNDVLLVNCVKNAEVISVVKTAKSTAKKETSKAIDSTESKILQTPEIIKNVKAASISSGLPQNNSPSLLIQIIKMLTGLMAVFLVLLIFKVRRYPKPIVIGGHFGQDDT